MHGANDPDVPIPDAEQFYIALKDVGVETEFVMYPREGHGIREVKHQIDDMDRSIVWYEKHFPDKSAAAPIPQADTKKLQIVEKKKDKKGGV